MSLTKKSAKRISELAYIKEEFKDDIKVKVELNEFPGIQHHHIERIEYLPELRRKKANGSFTPLKARCTKNIVKNYGKAICNFAASKISKPYLEPLLEKKKIQEDKFIDYVIDKKGGIENIDSFRMLFIITKDDSETEAACKEILKELGIIFIKFFSVNWIFHSKITHKEAHLKFRFKMIRRINNPELFTYLRSFNKKTQ